MKVHTLGYWGTYPGPGEATTGFLVEGPQGKVLLDCGSGVLAQLFQVCAIRDLDAVIITHHHHDHTADLGVFGYAVLLSRLTGERTAKLPVYMPTGAPKLEEEFRAEPLIDLHLIDEASLLSVAGLTVRFARTVHAVYCLAVQMTDGERTFVFSSDSSWCPSLQSLATGADLFLCEASMYAHQVEEAKATGHLTAPQAGRLARDAGVKRLAITHFPHYGNLEELVQQAADAYGGPVTRVETRQVMEV